MTEAERDQLRAYVGDEPTDEELDRLWGLHGSVPVVAHLVLSRRLQTLQAAEPLQVTFDGDLTEDYTENVRSLERSVKQLAPLAAAASGVQATVTTGHLRRPSRR